MRQMLQVLYSVAVCMRGHNSPASSNEEGGIDSSCDDYELDDYFPTGSQSCSHHHSSYESREDRERECCKVCIVILSSSDPPEYLLLMRIVRVEQLFGG